MGRTLFWFVITLIGVSLFFGAAMSRDVIEPWLAARGIVFTDIPYLQTAGKLVLTVAAMLLVGAPLTIFLYSLAAMGSDQAGRDIHGYTELRLKSGTRMVALIAVGFLLFVFAMAFSESATLVGQIFCFSFGMFFLWGGVWLWRVRLRFDNSVLLAPDYLGRVHRHEWRDLERIESNKEAMEYHLWFSTGKKARVSYFFAGLDQVMIQAQEALYQNA